MADVYATAPRRRPLSLTRPLATLVLVGIAGLLAGCGDKDTGAAQATRLKFANAGPEARYVGSAGCTECHEDEAKAHGAAAHANSFGVVAPEDEQLPATVEHEASAVVYRLEAKDGALRVRESLRMDDGTEEALSERTLTHWIGSGGQARQYTAEPDGFLVLAPVVRGGDDDGWRIDPECEGTLQNGFTRAIAPDCIRCHAGRASQVDGAVHRYRFDEVQMGCERCHGPGSVHVEHHRGRALEGAPVQATDAPDLTIVNPAHLSRDDALAVCAQCHMSEALTVLRPGRQPGAWQPALPWEAVHVTYRRTGGRSFEIPDASQVDLLAASRCFAGSDTLTCTTCHDAHASQTAEAVRAATRAACVDCHGDCKRSAETTPAPTAGEDCATCHMPARGERIPHQPFHDHRIGVPGRVPVNPVQAGPAQIAPFLGDVSRLEKAQQQRLLGMALLRDAGWFRSATDRTRAVGAATALLDTALAAGVNDLRFRQSRALALQMQAGDDARGQALAEATAVLDAALDGSSAGDLAPEEIQALLEYVLVLMPRAEGPSPQRRKVLEGLVKLRRSAFDWSQLAGQYAPSGEKERALEAMLRAVEIWPTHPTLRHDVGGVLFTSGRRDAAAVNNRIFLRLAKQQSYVAPRKPR